MVMIPQQIDDPFTDLAPGNYRGRIDKVELRVTKTNKLMYVAEVRISEPREAANRVHFENFVIGTEDDPSAERPETWTKTAGRMKQFSDAAGVPFLGQDPNVVIMELAGKTLDFKVNTRVDKVTGEKRAQISKWATQGTFQPEIEAVGMGGMAAQAAPAQSFQQPAPQGYQPLGGTPPAQPPPQDAGYPNQQVVSPQQPGPSFEQPPVGQPPGQPQGSTYEQPAGGPAGSPPAYSPPVQPGVEQGNANQAVGGPPVPLP